MLDSNDAKNVLLLGATEYAAVFVDAFETVPGIRFVGCVQNLDPAAEKREILGRPVYWTGSIGHLRKSHELICILGTTKRSGWIAEIEEQGFEFATLVHPSSTASQRTKLGYGVSVDGATVIAGFSLIHNHVRIGRRVSIGHHTEIGRYSTVHPGALISGYCKVGEQVTIGTGAVILDRINIGDGAFVAAGALVTKDVPPGALVGGHPARIIKPNYGPK